MPLTKADLTSRVNDLREKANGLAEQFSAEKIGQQVNTVQDQFQKIEQRGYAFLADLKRKLPDLRDQWDTARDQLHDTLTQQQVAIKKVVGETGAYIERVKEVDTAGLNKSETMVNTLQKTVEDAEEALGKLVEPITSAINAITSELYKIDRYLDARDEASFDFESGERVILADKAEWVVTGKGKEDPDGIVYLTDRRVIFEQKEKTGKKLGLFGGKKEQEIEWAITLDQIANIETENKGLLGGKDMITLTLSAGAEHNPLVMEIKSADNKFWKDMLEKAKSGKVE